MMNTDLLIIGAGPAGYRAAAYAAQQGLQVVIAEKAEVGGTCLNRGCIPTKTYVHSASFAEAVERQHDVVNQLRAGVESILAHPQITLLRGTASFLSPRSVSVGDKEITADHVMIATGSRSKLLPLPDIADERLVTSTELLQLQTLPQRLCVIGAGVIGMEFASIFHRFGSQVHVVEYLKECLPMLDADIAKRLRKLMEKKGITFKMKTAVQQLSDLDADVILMATGRQANTEGLNLRAAGITTTPQGSIAVDDHFRVTGAHDIYAVGDVNGRQLLAHAAEMQAIHAVNQMVGREDHIRFDIMPAAIFTTPEAACVGPTEEQLKATGKDYHLYRSYWRANGKALTMGECEGMLKLLSDGDDRIVGCHAYGAHAADIIQEVSVLMCRDTTITQLRDMVHIHPTLGEVLHAAVE